MLKGKLYYNLYFKYLNRQLPARCGVLISATHGKLYNRWMLPAEVRSFEYKGQRITDEVNKGVMNFIGEQMDLLFARRLGQLRTSDSISHTEMDSDALLNMPLPSCDADVEISKATQRSI